MINVNSFVLYGGALATAVYLYKELDLQQTFNQLKTSLTKPPVQQTNADTAEENAPEIWGQDNNVNSLPNKIDLEYNVFYNQKPEEVKQTVRTLATNSGDNQTVFYSDDGVYFSSQDVERIYTLADTYISNVSNEERLPYHNLDYSTQLPANMIQAELQPSTYEAYAGELQEVQTAFDPTNTYDNQPLFHSDQFEGITLY